MKRMSVGQPARRSASGISTQTNTPPVTSARRARPAPDAPVPVGAAVFTAWEHDQPMPSRAFFGMPRGITGRTIVVGAAGHQWADGSIEPVASIEIVGHLEGLNSDEARELASALLQAADEADRWLAP